MGVAVNEFTVNKDYVFSGPTITSVDLVEVSEAEQTLSDAFNYRLIPAFQSVAEVERSLE